MSGYLDLAAFRERTLAPPGLVDDAEDAHEGWIDGQLSSWSRKIDARLRKRYAAPFAAPVPETVLEWLTQIVTVRVYLKRGVDPNDQQFEEIRQDAKDALAEIAEAANSETGLFDLPLLDAADGSAVSKGGPYGYSEASPYVWTDLQADVGRDEDRNGEGTYG